MPKLFFHATVIFWIAFIIYWIVSAKGVKKETEQVPGQWIHRVFFILAAILLFFRRLPDPLGIRIVPHSVLNQSIALMLCAVGLAGAIWSRKTLAGNWSGRVTFKEDHELIQKGPYSLVRHPIYTSIMLMFIGTVLSHGILSSFIAFLFFLIGAFIKISQEEKLMSTHFTNEYAAYKRRVKMLIPFVL